MDWAFERDNSRIDQENISPDINVLGDKSDEKVSTEPLKSKERFALLPVFSKGVLSVGIRVQACISGSLGGHSSTHSSKFVFDNKDTTFLAVGGTKSPELVNVTFMSHSIASGKIIAFLQFDEKVFRRLVATGKMLAPLLLNALLSCDVYRESKDQCEICSALRAESCSCAHTTTIPPNPMHFGTLAPNFVLYGGQFSARKISWKRSFAGVLIQHATISAMCRIDISVNEKLVSALCDFERSGDGADNSLAELANEVSERRPLVGRQKRAFDLGESDQDDIPKGSKENKDAESMLSERFLVSSSQVYLIGKSQRKNFQETSTSIIR